VKPESDHTTTTPLDIFRVYLPGECEGEATDSGKGYPVAWRKLPTSAVEALVAAGVDIEVGVGLKDAVRAEAGHRCVRCGHPFVVGKSGVMEGPHAAAKAFAAELGVSVEQLDLAMVDVEDLPPVDFASAPRTNWSSCDERCTHGGPVRLHDVPGNARWGYLDTLADGVTAGSLVRYDVEAAWRILTVHHLNEVKRDCRWWNLVALCQRCHLNVQRRVTMDRPYPWDHSEWFLPYVAGFYAAKYSRENLTREQVETRLPALLELGRQQEAVERMPL
jgi:hypothetical protein